MALKVITYFGPGNGANTKSTVYIAEGATVDTEWTNITTTGQFTTGTLVQYAIRYDSPIIDVVNGANIFRGGTASATHGAVPSANDQLIGKTTSVDLADGTTNNWAVGGYNMVNVTGLGASATITGIAGGTDGATLVVVNNTGQDMTMAYDSGSSDAANRIYTATGGNISITGNGSFVLIYVGALSRWYVISSEAAGSGTGDVIGPASATDNAVVRFDGTGGKTIQNSGVTITDTNDITAATIKVNNTGLTVLDTNASHTLTIKPGSDLTANKTLTITTGDANRTLTLTGDASITGTNTGDQLLRSTVRAFTNGSSIAQNLTRYATLDGPISVQTNDPSDPAQNYADYAWIAPFNGTIRNLWTRCSYLPAAGQTFTITVMRNGVAGVLTATITDAAKTASDTSNSVSFSAGDLLSWKIVTSATSGSFDGTIAAEIRAD